MIYLSNIFSNHALFQHSTTLDIRGKVTSRSLVKAYISDGETIFSDGSCLPDENGLFCITLATPSASFTKYELVVSCADEKKMISDILFGEFWYACGQSNMEITNSTQYDMETMRLRAEKLNLRFLYIAKPLNNSDFPFEPIPAHEAHFECAWADATSADWFSKVSSPATGFAVSLYEFLNTEDKQIPVGFACTCRGGSSIETWIPKDEFTQEISDFFVKTKKPTTLETWNTPGDANYQQPSAYYNYLMESFVGVRARGMLWYQGETNCGEEYKHRIYAKMMIALRNAYKKRYAGFSDFPVVSSLIYPWTYGPNGECWVGYLNDALVSLMKDYPSEFISMPIGDLPLTWMFDTLNHPIHPTHKYELGERFTSLITANTYNRKTKQTLPATLKSVKKVGNALMLTFDSVGDGLFVKGSSLQGLYIRSSKGVYTSAKYSIIAKNKLLVYHPYIENPAFVAYAVSSAQNRTNLWAGDFPVCPFCTEFKKGKKEVFIQVKNFLDTAIDSEWITACLNDTVRVSFNNPIFHQVEGEVCYDNDFSLSGRSLRVIGELNKPLSFFVKSYPYHELDLQNYSALHVCLLNTNNLVATLYAEVGGKTIEIVGEKVSQELGDWWKYSFPLDKIKKTCDKITFSFRFDGDNYSPCTVNLDNFLLVPKK